MSKEIIDVPKFYEFLPYVLETLDKHGEQHISEIRELTADLMKLSDNQKRDMLPSGKLPKYKDRVNWACTYLKHGEMINNPKRGYYSISELGSKFINKNGYSITLKDLEESDKFKKFKGIDEAYNDRVDLRNPEEVDVVEYTPEELIENSFIKLNQQLAEDLISEVLNMDPFQFEILVLTLLHKMGYGGSLEDAIITTSKTGDGGIDGLIKEDPLGLEYIYVQAKRWKDGVVGSPNIQQFLGAVASSGARKGVFITSSTFSKDAKRVVNRNNNFKIILIDGNELAKLMIDYNIGVSSQRVYEIKTIDQDFFT